MDPRQLKMVPQTLRELSQLGADERARSAYITDHMQEILGLPPEIARIDTATFIATTGAGAGITAQPATVRFNADYKSELFAIVGFVDDVITDDGLGSEAHIEFNIREQGRNFDLWTTGMRMSALMSRGGSLGQLEFPRGAYVFQPGCDVQVRFVVDAAFAGISTVGKTWGVMLMLNLARAK